MKFENVKVGDTVFTETKVRYGWQSAEIFFTPEKVVRVTKTQFVVDSGNRYKKEGNMIGDSFTYAYKEGDRTHYTKSTVCDQTEKMIAFRDKLDAESRIKNTIEGITLVRNSDLSLDDLKKAEKILSKFIKALNVNKK